MWNTSDPSLGKEFKISLPRLHLLAERSRVTRNNGVKIQRQECETCKVTSPRIIELYFKSRGPWEARQREKYSSREIGEFVGQRNVQSRLKPVSTGRLVKCSRIIAGGISERATSSRDPFHHELNNPRSMEVRIRSTSRRVYAFSRPEFLEKSTSGPRVSASNGSWYRGRFTRE